MGLKHPSSTVQIYITNDVEPLSNPVMINLNFGSYVLFTIHAKLGEL